MIDAPAVLEYLFRTPIGAEVASIIEAPDADLHVPAVCDVEVAEGIDRAVELGLVDQDAAGLALGVYADLPVTRYGHVELLSRIHSLAGAFDATRSAYVALAERLDATLLTADPELTRIARELLTLNVLGVGTSARPT